MTEPRPDMYEMYDHDDASRARANIRTWLIWIGVAGGMLAAFLVLT